MKKKYCIFSAQFLPHMGGVENYTYNLAKKLVEKENEVTIVTSNVEHVKSYEKMEGIDVYRMPCFNLLGGRFPVLKANREFMTIHRIISARKYDLIIINTRFYIHSLYAIIFGRCKKIRSIFIEHGTGHLTMHNIFLDLLENIVEHSMTIVERKLCKEFYGVSEACLEWLQHFHIQGKGTLYNAIDIEKIEKQKQNPVCSFREKLQIPDDAIVITFTGRLLKEKGIITLVQAVDGINQRNKKVYLLIAGDGDEYEKIQSMKTHNIIPLGRISLNEVFALLNETDIFCLPSDSEGMSTSILEAAAFNNYIVTTRRGGARELIIDKSYGIIIDNNDLISVQDALEEAIASPGKRKIAVQLTYERLKDYFTWDIVAEKVMNL